MPELSGIDLGKTYKPEPTGVQEFFSKLQKGYRESKDKDILSGIISEHKKNRDNLYANEDLQFALEESDLSPTRRLQFQQTINESNKNLIEQQKVINAKFRAHAQTEEEREAEIQVLMNNGMPREEAEWYASAPNSVKNRIGGFALDRKGRQNPGQLSGQESQQKPSETAIESREAVNQAYEPNEAPMTQPEASNEAEVQSQAPQQTEAPQEAAPVAQQAPVKPQWPVIPPPSETTAAEREKNRVANQKDNVKALEENHKKVRAIRDDQLALRRMQQLNDTGKLPSGLERWIAVNPDTGDVTNIAKRSGKVNPETQAYVKEVNKFIRNAKDYYGARVTNFDLQTFLAQLPTLSNTEQGRRLILKEMELESQLQGLYANKMDQAIKHYGRNANLIDITRVVDEQIKDEEAPLIRKMDLSLEASNILNKMAANPKQYKNSVLVEKDGQFLAIPQEDVADAQSDGWSEY